MYIDFIYRYISYNGYKTGRMDYVRTVDIRDILHKYSKVSNPDGLIHPFREITYQHAKYWVDILSYYASFDPKYEEPFFITDNVAPVVYRFFLQYLKNIFDSLKEFLEEKDYYGVDYDEFKDYVYQFDVFIQRMRDFNRWLCENTGKKYKLPGFNVALLKNPSLQYSAPRRTHRWEVRNFPQFQYTQSYDSNKTLGHVHYLH